MAKDERRVIVVSLTMLFCISFGTALNSWTGVLIGVCMGIAFGLFNLGESDEEQAGEGRLEK